MTVLRHATATMHLEYIKPESIHMGWDYNNTYIILLESI